MSALLANLLPSGAEGGAVRSLLRPVRDAAPGRLARMPFILILALILGAGLAGVLVLNTSIQEQSVQLRQLQREANVLGYQEAALQTQADQLAASSELARRATELGMRPNPNPAFIKVPSGEVLGVPHVIRGDEAPAQIYHQPTAPTALPEPEPAVSPADVAVPSAPVPDAPAAPAAQPAAEPAADPAPAAADAPAQQTGGTP